MNPAGKILEPDTTESEPHRLPLPGRSVISFRRSSARLHLKGLPHQGSDETRPQKSVAAEVTRLTLKGERESLPMLPERGQPCPRATNWHARITRTKLSALRADMVSMPQPKGWRFLLTAAATFVKPAPKRVRNLRSLRLLLWSQPAAFFKPSTEKARP